MRKKVLILSASTGGGHNRAANAVKEELELLDIECVIVDAIKLVGRAVDVVISKGYEKSAIYAPNTYGHLYNISDHRLVRKGMDRNVLISYLSRRILSLINSEKPDAIIGTHAFPVIAVSRLKEKGLLNLPLFSIITDYTIHAAHIAKEVDGYIVGDEYIESGLIIDGVHHDMIHPFGIPVEKSFMDDTGLEEYRKQLGLKDKFTVLLMGGSFGAGDIFETLKELVTVKEDIQIIVVAGRNESLYHKLEKYISTFNTGKDIFLLGFVKKMNLLMTMSDCIVTKPGGLTTTECILKELPMVVPFYIPGQEKENLDFLLNNGLAIKPDKNISLDVIIKALYNHPEKLERIRMSMRYQKKLDSAVKIAKLIEEKTK